MTFNLKNIVQDIVSVVLVQDPSEQFVIMVTDPILQILLHKQNANNKPTSFIVIDTKIVLIGYSIHI